MSKNMVPGPGLFALPLLAGVFGGCAGGETDWEAERESLVAQVEAYVTATSYETGRSQLSPKVVEALRTVPRHEFVPASFRRDAYQNRPLPIGADQTISQPYIVALMTELAEVDETSKVLEIGTGSGYQAAVLAHIVSHVYTIEIIRALGERAEQDLARLGYSNVSVRVGDGYQGWPEQAPFDAIIATAAPEEVPQPLIDQLAVGGRLVIPVGPQYPAQSLQVLTKLSDGQIETVDVLDVRFVPFTRE